MKGDDDIIGIIKSNVFWNMVGDNIPTSVTNLSASTGYSSYVILSGIGRMFYHDDVLFWNGENWVSYDKLIEKIFPQDGKWHWKE